MIKAEDLRVTNIVNDEDGEPMYIAGLWPVDNGKQYNWIDSAGNTGQVDQLSGIELNEEWLIKLGFTKTPVVQHKANWYHISGEFGISEFTKIGYMFEGPFLDLPIKYVHQLMNLYHALTGTELTTKP